MLVSVVIPTFNSQRTIRRCLKSIEHQSHSRTEIIVVDSNSTDLTAKMAADSSRVISIDSGIAKARYVGALAASGEFVLNLDSDQELRPNAIRGAIEDGHPMVAFGETNDGPGLLALLNRIDQAAIESAWAGNIDPLTGPIRPRFYERGLLLRSLESIPQPIREIKPSPFSEDSLIYYHASLHEKRVGFVPGAIRHLENPSIIAFERKWFGYGRSAQAYRGTVYEGFATRRGHRSGKLRSRAVSLPALLLKGVPFTIGFHT